MHPFGSGPSRRAGVADRSDRDARYFPDVVEQIVNPWRDTGSDRPVGQVVVVVEQAVRERAEREPLAVVDDDADKLDTPEVWWDALFGTMVQGRRGRSGRSCGRGRRLIGVRVARMRWL